jgi:hypothetical protein
LKSIEALATQAIVLFIVSLLLSTALYNVFKCAFGPSQNLEASFVIWCGFYTGICAIHNAIVAFRSILQGFRNLSVIQSSTWGILKYVCMILQRNFLPSVMLNFGDTTLGIMTYSIMTYRIKAYLATLGICEIQNKWHFCETQHNNNLLLCWAPLCWMSHFIHFYAVMMLSGVMPNDAMLSVVAPKIWPQVCS